MVQIKQLHEPTITSEPTVKCARHSIPCYNSTL